MKYAKRVVLKLPLSADADLARFVEDCVEAGVELICVCGVGAGLVEDELDWLIIADGRPEEQWIVTTVHPDEEDAMELAENWLPPKMTELVHL